MAWRCVAIDDEPLAVELISSYVAGYPELQLVQTFDDAISAAEYLRKNPVDILFLDINMPDITGLDLVRALDQKPVIVFTTAHKKFAIDGFDLDAVDYLLKPISPERFGKAVNKALEQAKQRAAKDSDTAGSLFVYSEYRLVKVPFNDIEYIESLEDYIRIHLVSAKPVLTLMPLKKVLEKLPPDKFRRIHRSYIVAIDKISSIQNRKIRLASSIELPVSDSYAAFIREWKK